MRPERSEGEPQRARVSGSPITCVFACVVPFGISYKLAYATSEGCRPVLVLKISQKAVEWFMRSRESVIFRKLALGDPEILHN